MFDPTSRYSKIDTATLTVIGTDGLPRLVTYVRRRFLPPLDGITPLTQHTVSQGERLDNITGRYAGDPTLFWRLCDANDVLQPEELEVVGRVIVIAAPNLQVQA